MSRRKGWLDSFLEPEVDRAERRSVDQFAAYRWDGTSVVQEPVRDVSTTGVYLLTQERWQPGTLLSLTLQREGPLETNSERRIDVRAKVARCEQDGVGLAFVFAKDDQARRWESLRESLIEEAKPEDMRTLVRIIAAVSFLSQICPRGAEEIGRLLRGRLSNHKVANALEIVLKTQNLLTTESPAQRLRAEPQLVVRILEDGSCTDEAWLRHFWGGLLATSCTKDGMIEELSKVLIDLFSQLTTYPVRILVVVCTRATKVMAESGLIFAKPLACNLEELMQTTGSRGLQIERDLTRLSDLGLIERRGLKSPIMLPSDEILITPTALGLQLFAHCNGQRGSLQEFYALDSPAIQDRVHQ